MAQEISFFRIGTGGTAGPYYPIDGLTANAISAFRAITACMAVYLIQRIMAAGVLEGVKETAAGIYEGFVSGARQSLAVTVAAALAGVVIGVVTLTGVGFKIAFMVTSVAAGWAASVHGLLAAATVELFNIENLTLLFTLMITAVVCVLMGCGVPTTANDIIMVAVAAPVLGMMNVEPPVALAAYAGAGIAGPTVSRPATPPSGCRWPRRWCSWSSSSRPRCCW